jgi:hypothetical protein
MARWCFWLAVTSPVSLALGWFLVSFPPLFAPGNIPALVLMAASPLAFLASAVIGLKQVFVGQKSGAGWLAAGLVIDYCWFHGLLASFIIQQVNSS